MIRVNGIEYRRPERPVVVVCIDGSDPAYHERGLADGILPNMARFAETGFAGLADGVVPSFTNPNNLSIVTGAPPAVHGIAGNFFLDPETGAEVMMNDPAFLRAESVLAAFSRAGAKVVVITAKDKLRRLLGHGIEGGICFSSEMAGGCTIEEHGIEDVLDLVAVTRNPRIERVLHSARRCCRTAREDGRRGRTDRRSRHERQIGCRWAAQRDLSPIGARRGDRGWLGEGDPAYHGPVRCPSWRARWLRPGSLHRGGTCENHGDCAEFARDRGGP